MNESFDWRYFGKIAASIALSVIIGLFWMSNNKKDAKITSNPNKFDREFTWGSLFARELTTRTLVVFWASWCATCKEDLEQMKELQASGNLPEGFSILAVNIDEPQNLQSANFIWNQLEMKNIKLMFDKDGRFHKALSIDLLPTYFLFEKSGKTLLRLEGKVDFSDSKVKSLLFN